MTGFWHGSCFKIFRGEKPSTRGNGPGRAIAPGLLLGPVNTYFATRVAARKSVGQGAKRRTQGTYGQALYGKASRRSIHVFSCATRRDGIDFTQPVVTHRLQRLALRRGSCLVLNKIRRRRGREISVNRP